MTEPIGEHLESSYPAWRVSVSNSYLDAYAHTQVSATEGCPRPRPSVRLAGDRIAGKYVLERFLAHGGMAEVWLATHESLKTEVAIKFVHEHLTRDPEVGACALERFRFEAQISAHLGARTRHVVAVRDAGTHEGAPYLVMEYVPGRTLEAEIEADGPISADRFANVLDQVADALDAAHALGIVHRDLKPSNLLLSRDADGTLVAKVADFGVAKALRESQAFDSPRRTQAGEMIGSPAFMSPEQISALDTIDGRSDVWSLGVVAYEAMTGQPCFQGATLLDVFATVAATRYRPASSVRPDLPGGIDAWLGRALAPSPDDRFESVGAMARAFRALLVAPALPRRPPFAVAALVAALTLFGGTALLVARVGVSPRPALASTKASVDAGAPSPTGERPGTTVVAPASTASTAAEIPSASTLAAVAAPRKRWIPRLSERPSAMSLAAPPAAAPPPAETVPSAAAPPPPPAPPRAATQPDLPPKRIDPSEVQ